MGSILSSLFRRVNRSLRRLIRTENYIEDNEEILVETRQTFINKVNAESIITFRKVDYLLTTDAFNNALKEHDVKGICVSFEHYPILIILHLEPSTFSTVKDKVEAAFSTIFTDNGIIVTVKAEAGYFEEK